MRESRELTQADEENALALCTFFVGGRLFGIDTASIREVLGKRPVERVPLAPGYIAGVVPYRGEIVTAVCGRRLLHFGPESLEPVEVSVLVLEATAGGAGVEAQERFALAVDRVGGVTSVDRRQVDTNPSTLRERERTLFQGAFATEEGLLVQLDARELNPVRLAGAGWLPRSAVSCANTGARAAAEEDLCER